MNYLSVYTLTMKQNKQILSLSFITEHKSSLYSGIKEMPQKRAQKLALIDNPVSRHFVLLISTSLPFSRRSSG